MPLLLVSPKKARNAAVRESMGDALVEPNQPSLMTLNEHLGFTLRCGGKRALTVEFHGCLLVAFTPRLIKIFHQFVTRDICPINDASAVYGERYFNNLPWPAFKNVCHQIPPWIGADQRLVRRLAFQSVSHARARSAMALGLASRAVPGAADKLDGNGD